MARFYSPRPGYGGGLWPSEISDGSPQLSQFSAPLIDAGVCYVQNPRSLPCFVFSMRRAAINRWCGSLLSKALSKTD